MTQRRELLKGLVAGTVAGAISGQAFAAGNGSDGSSTVDHPCDCCGSGQPDKRRTFPNVVVYDQTGRRALFYRDLLQGRTVLVNFMSIAHHEVYPVTRFLANVHRELGERAGRDILMLSLTIDPEQDTPAALNRFAARHGAGPGWLFLTGQAEPLALLRESFFVGHAGHHHQRNGHHQEHGQAAAPAHDCSLGVVRYGCEPTGTWGTVPAKASAEWIIERCSWVQPREVPTGPPRRKGPPPLA